MGRPGGEGGGPLKQILRSRKGLAVVREVPVPACPPGGVLVRNRFSVISAGTESAAVAEGQKSLRARARERPELVGEVLNRVRREGVRATHAAVRRRLNQESAMGYSSAGEVLEVGAAVTGLVPGDPVACAGAGYANHAAVVAVPRNLCTRVPAGVPLEVAAFTTIAAIALHGIRLADVRLGERVALIGCGLVGQVACRLLAAAGAEVFAIDVEAGRAEDAGRGGADHWATPDRAAEVVREATEGQGADRVIVTAGAASNEPLLLGADLARDRAAIVVVGDVPVELPRAPLFRKELSLRVSRSYGPGRYDASYEEHGIDYPIGYVRWTQQRNMEAILDLEARGRLDLRDLVDEVVPVQEAASAYERLTGPAEGRPRGAIVVSYPGGDELRLSRPASPVERPRAAVAGDQVRVGLLGPGNFATAVLVPALQRAGARLELVAGGSGPSAAAALRDHGFARTAADEDALLADPGIDAVVVATRHGTHADLAARALRSGKHVFCEKPLALSLEELDDVMAAARETDRVLGVGFNRRFAPLMAELSSFLAAEPGPLTASYRVSAGAIPDDHWVHDLAEGGGRALGEACHFVDSLAFLARAPVVEVHAAAHGAPELPAQARDNLVITLRFADGSVGAIAYVAQGSPRLPKERLEAFRGTRTGVLDDYRVLELSDATTTDRREPKTQDKGHDAEIAAFLEAVRAGRDPVPLTEVETVSLATLAAVESVRTGRPVRLAS